MATTSPSPFNAIFSGRVHVAGGVPSTVPDVPVCAVLILAYLVGAAGNVMLFVRYGMRFRNLAITSLVFLNAGVLIIFLLNLQMCKMTIFRTHYVYFTNNPSKKDLIKKIFAGISLLLLPFLAISITGAIQSFLTDNASIQAKDSILKHIGVCVFLVYSFLPFPILSCNAFLRLKNGEPRAVPSNKSSADFELKLWRKNGTLWYNSAFIICSASLVILEYTFKIIEGFASATIPHWYFSKATFYCLSILPELFAMYTLLFSDMPKRYAGLARFKKEDQLDHSMVERLTPAWSLSILQFKTYPYCACTMTPHVPWAWNG
ncbi:MAG: hypothetical protein CYPHOPRED_004551 [Cyphobasidiales sp. Tagirdzhanova-0007]|nr:MAG: hypothetical protein CYPHOPRED_004551 [Cyphobasidiales sp. Tagirdzhanova-0007]